MDDRLREALETVVARTGHARFRELCDPAHPDHNPAVAAEVLRMAGDAPQPPSLLARAGNFASAVVSHVSAGLPTLDPAAVEARLAVCRDPVDNSRRCDRFLPPNSCAVCGCNLAVKASWAEKVCPLGKWPVPVLK